ncbi:MAG TPA: response regulator transcription factor [Actinoplanes sp.]|jgi:two-component system nitrate/nitrite response regulator NarL|nr:response regulator transcription factor [Actinoplanes sp.]
MRIVICAEHILFAESLAHLLTVRGKRVVAITHDLDRAAVVLRSTPADVFLLDVAVGAERALGRLARLRAEVPQTRVILLSGAVDRALVTAGQAAGVRAIADKRQPVAEIIDLLERVHAGERVPTPVARTAPAAPQSWRWAVNDAQRLAAFLTPREREVLSALVCGDDTKKVARSLGIAAATARCHIQSLLTKMGAHSRLEAATTAVRSGMINPETGQWLTPTG